MHVEPRSAGSPTPSQLLASCGVIERVYLEHAPLLRRVAVRKFGIPPADADTLVHDVFAAYIANPGAVRSDLRAYLIAAICNASRNYWRTKEMQERDSTCYPGEETTGQTGKQAGAHGGTRPGPRDARQKGKHGGRQQQAKVGDVGP